MAILEIVKFDAPVLREKAKPVKKISPTIRRLLDDMVETMVAAPGVGLAGPQVGVSKRVIVVDMGEGEILQLINPVIAEAEGVETAAEGCLSLPGLFGEVPRAARVVVEALDRNGRKVWKEATGLAARALQHEIDHLDGILFVDKATAITITDDDDQAEEVDDAGPGDAAQGPGTVSKGHSEDRGEKA